jgi:integration host factor subunit alpha
MELALDSLDTTALTKAQLADALFDQLGLNKREAKDFVDAFFEVVLAELAKGESVKISGFGNFVVHTKAARPGRNLGWMVMLQLPFFVLLCYATRCR